MPATDVQSYKAAGRSIHGRGHSSPFGTRRRAISESVLAILASLLASSAQVAWASPPRNESVFLEDLTTAEVARAVHAGNTTVLMFGGGTEETGPHIALGKHNFRVRKYAGEIASRLGSTLVAPILPFAPNGDSLKKFPGTLSLSVQTFSAVNEEVARSLVASGFRRIVLMSDHLASQQPLQDLASRLDAELAPSGVRVIFSGAGYDRARTLIESELRSRHLVPGGHGGLWDTSETWAAAPWAVRPKLFAPGDLSDEGNGPIDANGVSGDPRNASRALGRHFAEIRIQLATEEIRAALRTVNQVPEAPHNARVELASRSQRND